MGNLYIVATPIGNLQDITIRAIQTLFTSDIIVAEQPDKTSLMLTKLQENYPEIIKSHQKPKVISCNEFQEEQKIPDIIAFLTDGKNVALVSEAGTPLLSDPGFKLVRECYKRSISVIPIPGSSSITAALSASPLPTDKFFFLGFLPKQAGKKENLLKSVKELLGSLRDSHLSPTVIVFESPHRIKETLDCMLTIFGDIEVVIARELTKLYEQVQKKNISEFIEQYRNNEVRGELVILFHL